MQRFLGALLGPCKRLLGHEPPGALALTSCRRLSCPIGTITGRVAQLNATRAPRDQQRNACLLHTSAHTTGATRRLMRGRTHRDVVRPHHHLVCLAAFTTGTGSGSVSDLYNELTATVSRKRPRCSALRSLTDVRRTRVQAAPSFGARAQSRPTPSAAEMQRALAAATELAVLLWAASVLAPHLAATTHGATSAAADLTLEAIVRRINQTVGTPAEAGRTVSREAVGVPEGLHIHLDVGGEGRLIVDGYVTGFPDAINLNDTALTTVTPYERPIPHLVMVQPWHSDPAYPFATGFADHVSMMGAPLTDKNVTEIARVLSDTGCVDLWVDNAYSGRIERLAALVSGRIAYPPEEAAFLGNGGVHRRVRVIAGQAAGRVVCATRHSLIARAVQRACTCDPTNQLKKK